MAEPIKAPGTKEEWVKLITEVDKVIKSPSERAAEIRKVLDRFSTYDIVCFCILMLPTLWLDVLDSIPTLKSAVKYQINLLRHMHYVHKMYEESDSLITESNVISREADTSKTDAEGAGSDIKH